MRANEHAEQVASRLKCATVSGILDMGMTVMVLVTPDVRNFETGRQEAYTFRESVRLWAVELEREGPLVEEPFGRIRLRTLTTAVLRVRILMPLEKISRVG